MRLDLSQKYSLAPSPDYVPLRPGQRLIVVGDIHGDYGLLVRRLRAGRVLEDTTVDEAEDVDGAHATSSHRWKRGETAVVVQVGDILDRGSHELECLALLGRLSHEAAAWGGAVVVLLGNHEMMNIGGDFRCVVSNDPWKREFDSYCAKRYYGHDGDWKKRYYTPSPNHNLPSFPARWAACQPGGILSSCFFAQCKVAVQVGATICVHAHWGHRCFDTYLSIANINRRAATWIAKSCCPWYASGDERFIAIDESMEHVFPVPEPFWGQDSAGSLAKNENEISDILARFPADAHRIVVGHERCDHIHSSPDGYIWKVDAPDQGDVLEVNHVDAVQVLKPRLGYSHIIRRLLVPLFNQVPWWITTLFLCQAAIRGYRITFD